MKKITVAALVIVAMLFSLLPMSSAIAKKSPGNLNLYIRNRTGGTVSMVLYSESGKKIAYSFPDGMYKERLPIGLYNYYIITPCEKLVGAMSLNGNKQLYFNCNQGISGANTSELSPAVAVPSASTTGCTYKFSADQTNGGWVCDLH